MHFNKGNILVETTEQMIFYLGLKISKEFIRQRGRKKVLQARKQHEQRHGGVKVLLMLRKQQADQIVPCDKSIVYMGE